MITSQQYSFYLLCKQEDKCRGSTLTAYSVILQKYRLFKETNPLILKSQQDLNTLRDIAQYSHQWSQMTARIREAAKALLMEN